MTILPQFYSSIKSTRQEKTKLFTEVHITLRVRKYTTQEIFYRIILYQLMFEN